MAETTRAARNAVGAMFFLNGALFGTWAARIPAFVERMGLGEGAFGMLLLSMAAGALVSFPLAGRLSDRLGAAPMTRWIAGVYVVATLAVALAPGPAALAVALAAFGAGHGAMDVTMNVWGTEVERARGRPVMSTFHAMWSLGAGGAAALGAGAAAIGMAPSVHFAAACLAMAALAGAASRVAWRSETGGAARGPAIALPRRALLPIGLIALGAGLGEGATADWSALYLSREGGFGEARAALGYAVFSVAMVTGRLLGDRVIAVVGAVRAARASGLCAAIGAAWLAAAPGLAPFVLLGLGYAVVVPLAYARAAAEPGGAGRGVAEVATLGYGAMLLGPPLIGWVGEVAALSLAFAGLAGLGLVSAALAGALARPHRAAMAA